MIKSYRKYQRHYEKQHEHMAIIRADDEQEEETNRKNDELCRDHVGENRADEKAVLTLEKRHAMRAMVPDMKRGGDNLRFTTHRTTQSQTTPQYPFDLFKVCFQVVSHINV